jgi:hypothetical protein
VNQNKGIGAYQNRPGYFMGGMIGGAILGALVNKIQGKDWKRGALMGGIGGGLGSVLSGSKFMPATGAKGNWIQNILFKQGGPGMSKWAPRFPALQMFGKSVSPVGLAGGAGLAYMMGDPAYDQKKEQEAMDAINEKEREKKLKFYSKWFTNPWTGENMFNQGGMINERPGYYNGGPAGMGGTWSDVPMEEGGPTQDPIPLQLPMGQEGSFEDENEGILGLDLAGLNDSERAELQSLMSLRLITPKDDPKYPQIEMRIQELMQGIGAQTERSIGPAGASTVSDDGTRMMAMSEPHPMEGWYNMYDDQINSGEFTGTFDEFMEMIRDSDFTPEVASGGLMRLHAKDGLWANMHAKRKRIEGGSGETMRAPGSKGAPTDKALRESQATGGIMGYYGGGMSDMDLTRGGASFGPGTGTSDDIPAMLSDGEFVVTANAVKNLGGGNRMLGAKKMYQMMNSLDPNSQTPAEMDTTGIA